MLFFSNPADPSPGRDMMTVRRSDDSGQTWGRSLLVWNASAAYSVLVPVNDTHIGVVFENGGYVAPGYVERISFMAVPRTLEESKNTNEAAVELVPMKMDDDESLHGSTTSTVSGELTELWVVPQQQGSLHAAVAAAARHPGPATIHLAPGRHVLTAPLVLDARHSGTRFVGHGGASVSGAQKVTGWSVVGPAKCRGCTVIWKAVVPRGLDSRQLYVNGVRANRTWAPFPANGTKPAMSAVITVLGVEMLAWKHNVSAIELVYRGANPNSAGCPWSESRCPTASIAAGPPPAPPPWKPGTPFTWGNISTGAPGSGSSCSGSASTCIFDKTICKSLAGQCAILEHEVESKCGTWSECAGAVCRPSYKGYCLARGKMDGEKTPRHDAWGYRKVPSLAFAPSAANTNSSAVTTVTVAQPCAWNGNNKIHGRQALRVPAFVENVFELIGDAKYGHPGEYFLDSAAGELYYVPHAGQDAKTTVGQLPILETLVNATGVSDVSHDGVAFELATWMGPSRGGLGFVDVQGGFESEIRVRLTQDPSSRGRGVHTWFRRCRCPEGGGRRRRAERGGRRCSATGAAA